MENDQQSEAPLEEEDQPEAPEAPETDQPEGEQVEDSFENFDLGGIPEDADRDWFAERVKAFQSDYTRKTQAAAEARKQALTVLEAAQDPNHPNHAEVMDYLGFEVADDDLEQDEDEDDPLSPLEQRLAALEARDQQAAQAAQQAQQQEVYEDALVDRLETLQGVEGVEFTEDELALIVNAAQAIPDDEGLPNVEQAYKLLTGAYAKRQKAYLNGKKNAPRPPGRGVPASRELDISDPQARLDAARAAIERAHSAD